MSAPTSSFLLALTGLQPRGEGDGSGGNNGTPELGWENVAVASGFIVVNGAQMKTKEILSERLTKHMAIFFNVDTGIMSLVLGLKLEASLIIASVRCLVQLTIMVKPEV